MDAKLAAFWSSGLVFDAVVDSHHKTLALGDSILFVGMMILLLMFSIVVEDLLRSVGCAAF